MLFAQTYQQGKIDMHGGKYDSYKELGGYKDNGFGKPFGNMSNYLDKKKEKTKEKKKDTSK